ncbi:MAG: NAD(P)/FAD-dependent oxidoreductase [Gemmatimonadota bacterium]
MTRDVIIVGAGPAGSASAIDLARRGFDVLLLDARSFPRSKPCGDAISPGAIPLLERLGVWDAVRAAPCEFIDGWSVRSPAGTWFDSTFSQRRSGSPPHGLCIDRALLDHTLVEAARASGVEVIEGMRVFDLMRAGGRTRGVVARGPDGETRAFDGRFVVGADGLRSRVARRLGPVTRGKRARLALVSRWSGVDGPRGRGEMRVSGEGALGFVALGGGTANVTMVVPIAEGSALAPDPLPFFRDRAARYGLERRLEGARLDRPIEVTGPFEVTPYRRTAPGTLLAGDAAGYLDPFTGQGVFRALDGATIAVDAVTHILRETATEPAALRAYERELTRRLRVSRAVQRGVDFVISRPGRIDALAGVLRAQPRLASWLADTTGDRVKRRV